MRYVISPLATFRALNGKVIATGPFSLATVGLSRVQQLLFFSLRKPKTISELHQEVQKEGISLNSKVLANWVLQLTKFGLLESIGKASEKTKASFLGKSDLRCHQILQFDLGHSRALISGSPVDAKGEPIPLLCYPAIDFLSQFDLRNKTVLEFGSGNSTRWWARRARHLISIETNESWYRQLKRLRLKNVRMIFEKDPKGLAKVFREQKTPFDIIVIDHAYNRSPVAQAVIQRYKRGSLIILDNSEWHHDAVKHLRHPEFIEVNMSGFAPGEDWIHVTTFFFHREFDFPRRNSRKPFVPIGGLSL